MEAVTAAAVAAAAAAAAAAAVAAARTGAGRWGVLEVGESQGSRRWNSAQRRLDMRREQARLFSRTGFSFPSPRPQPFLSFFLPRPVSASLTFVARFGFYVGDASPSWYFSLRHSCWSYFIRKIFTYREDMIL
jgi:opacity protein-like surface antigen